MTKTGGVGEDLRYVRAVVDKAETVPSPKAIYYLWAVLVFVGGILIDTSPRNVGLYWLIAGPAGGIVSALLGWRAGRQMGQESSRVGTRHGLHWLGMLVAIGLAMGLVATGDIPGRSMAYVALLIVALGYYTAGIYLERKLLWVGLLMAVCFVAVQFFRELPYLWTLTTAVIALGLVVSAHSGGYSRSRTEPDGDAS